jgi:hypothetical protein
MSGGEIMPDRRQAPTAMQRLAEELYRERVAEARAMRPEDKLLAGEELFEYACAITLAGIRDQSPGLSDEEQLRVLEERLALRESMDKRG